jgi:predicted dehydrogenase
MNPVTLIIAGAGSRGGRCLPRYILRHPDKAKIVGVAEPREAHREEMARIHGIPRENVFADWKEMAKRPKFADAVIIATQDAMHLDPALAFAKRGYAMLLEKPMAPTAADCRKITAAVKKAGVIFSIAHVLRYQPVTVKLKKLLDSGLIGEIVSLQRLEPVGFWHQAHSYVRGNWRNEKESSSMLLAKSCHDVDWIRYIMGARCKSVSSFGTLNHFRKSERPSGAAKRCTLCKRAVERHCPYSARRIYLEMHNPGKTQGWPLNVIANPVSPATVRKAIEKGPYGRCVYACDNDVVDHQVVNFLFEDGRTASFTMTAFTRLGSRRTSIFGTRGELYEDGEIIRHYDFLSNRTRIINVPRLGSSIDSGHGGGDYMLMKHFIRAVAERNPKLILTGPDETLESHLMVFAAEAARRRNRVMPVNV